MSDTRTRREKLRDMAHQTESPQEAEVARRKLGKGFLAGRKPRRRPPVFEVSVPDDYTSDDEWEWDEAVRAAVLGKVED